MFTFEYHYVRVFVNNFKSVYSTFRVFQVRRTNSSSDSGDKNYAMKEVRCLSSKYFLWLLYQLLICLVVALIMCTAVVKLLFLSRAFSCVFRETII